MLANFSESAMIVWPLELQPATIDRSVTPHDGGSPVAASSREGAFMLALRDEISTNRPPVGRTNL